MNSLIDKKPKIFGHFKNVLGLPGLGTGILSFAIHKRRKRHLIPNLVGG